MSPALEVHELSVALATPQGPLEIVKEVSFDLEAGRTLGLVGESGSGKSVTALALLRLHDESTARLSGRVLIGGAEVLGMTAAQLTRLRGGEVGMVFQDPLASMNATRRVGAHVAEALTLHLGLTGAALRARTIELLREVGVPAPEARVDAWPHELSGGLRQRVMIAAALACGPRLLIADEPTTALDVTIQAQVMALLAAQQRARGMAMLLISHDLALVAEGCDEVLVLYAGRTMERGPARAVFSRPLHPYTAGLVGSTPLLGEERERLQEIPGTVPDLRALPTGCRFRDRCPGAQPDCAASEPAWRRVSTAPPKSDATPISPSEVAGPSTRSGRAEDGRGTAPSERFVRCHHPLDGGVAP